jgi:hypothetical protein
MSAVGPKSDIPQEPSNHPTPQQTTYTKRAFLIHSVLLPTVNFLSLMARGWMQREIPSDIPNLREVTKTEDQFTLNNHPYGFVEGKAPVAPPLNNHDVEHIPT